MRARTRTLFGWCVVQLLSVANVAAIDDLSLVEAVKSRNAVAVRALLDQRVDVNTPQPDGATALHWAAYRDEVEITDLLIRAGAEVNAANELGVTPLSLACVNGNAAIVEKLLKAGAKVNDAPSLTGESPLMSAARTGKLDVVNVLLAHGADVNAREPSQGQTALMWTVAERHAEVARVLIEHGADVHATSKSIMASPRQPPYFLYTASRGSGFTPLLFAAREGDLASARILVAAGANVNDAAFEGTSAVVVATTRGHTAVAEFLLEQGADPNAGGAGYTALHYAAGSWEGSVSGVVGIAPQLESREWRALAGLRGTTKIDFVKTLLSYGASPNARVTKNPPRFGHSHFKLNLAGATPFFLAALAGDVTVMRLLVAAGADPLLRTTENTSPVMAAAGYGRVPGESPVAEADALEALALTVEFGGDVNAANSSGDTALHGAATRGTDTIVRFLAERGAEVNVKNKSGVTPLTIAEGNGPIVAGTRPAHKSTADLLRTLGGTIAAPR